MVYTVNLTIQDPRDKQLGTILPRRSRIFGTVVLRYAMGNFSAEGIARGEGERFDDSENLHKLPTMIIVGFSGLVQDVAGVHSSRFRSTIFWIKNISLPSGLTEFPVLSGQAFPIRSESMGSDSIDAAKYQNSSCLILFNTLYTLDHWHDGINRV